MASDPPCSKSPRCQSAFSKLQDVAKEREHVRYDVSDENAAKYRRYYLVQSRIDKMEAAGEAAVTPDIDEKEFISREIEANLSRLKAAGSKVYYRKTQYVNAQIEDAMAAKRAKTAVASSASDETS